MQRTDSTTPTGSTPRAQTPPSPFGPVRKWAKPRPAPRVPGPRKPADHADDGPVIPKIPGPRPPADRVTPLALAGRRPTRPRPLGPEAQAEIDAWYAARTAAVAGPDPVVVHLRRLADTAHLAVDLDLYQDAA